MTRHSSPSTALALAILLGATIAAHAAGPTLTVVDKTGERHVLSGPTVDYTSYGMLYTPDFETGGLRILKGKAHITLAWSKISRLEVIDPTKLTAKVLLQSGGDTEVQLVADSREGLSGSSELGNVSLHLADIKTIEFNAPKSSPKTKK